MHTCWLSVRSFRIDSMCFLNLSECVCICVRRICSWLSSLEEGDPAPSSLSIAPCSSLWLTINTFFGLNQVWKKFLSPFPFFSTLYSYSYDIPYPTSQLDILPQQTWWTSPRLYTPLNICSVEYVAYIGFPNFILQKPVCLSVFFKEEGSIAFQYKTSLNYFL